MQNVKPGLDLDLGLCPDLDERPVLKVLIIKTSSLGDVVHALPAVSEAARNLPELSVDWVVEEGFTAIAARHPAVDRTLSIAIRRWRSNWWQARHEIRVFVRGLRSTRYDVVIDSQGLLKSALVAGFAKGQVHGFDRKSAREPIVNWFYQHSHFVNADDHAITRQKALFAKALGYVPSDDVDYGLRPSVSEGRRSIILFHGTTWASKEWPEAAWIKLAELIDAAGYELLVPAGNPIENARARRILGDRPGRVLDRLGLDELIEQMSGCVGAVAVDTGLGHLAPALGLPVVGIFGATSPRLTGMLGKNSHIEVSNHLPCIPCRRRDCQYANTGDSSNIHPPCYEQILPETVWQALQLQMGSMSKKLN